MRLKHSNPSGRATSSRRLSRWTALAVTSSRRETKPRACYGRPPNTCCITGSDVKAVRGMLDAAADAATNALPKIDSAAQGTLVDFNIEELLSGMNFSDGTLSIPKIASIKQDLSDAGAVLKRVKTSIHAVPQPRTEQITEMVNQGKQVVDQIDETFDTLNTIVEKIPG